MVAEGMLGASMEVAGEQAIGGAAEGLMVGAIRGVLDCVSVIVEVCGLEAASSVCQVCGLWWAYGSYLVYGVLQCSGV